MNLPFSTACHLVVGQEQEHIESNMLNKVPNNARLPHQIVKESLESPRLQSTLDSRVPGILPSILRDSKGIIRSIRLNRLFGKAISKPSWLMAMMVQ